MIAPLALLAPAALAAAGPASCSDDHARTMMLAEAAAAEPGLCVRLEAIAWNGRLYADVDAIYAGVSIAYRGDVPGRPMRGGPARMVFDPASREFVDAGNSSAPRATMPQWLHLTALTARCKGVQCAAEAAPTLDIVEADTVRDRPVERRLRADVAPAAWKLRPLAADSPWTARFAAAADALFPALRSGKPQQWVPLLGGRWLAAADRARVERLLGAQASPFASALRAPAKLQRVILGWDAATLDAGERALVDAGQEAEAIVCWSDRVDAERLWPIAAFDADNRQGRPYACARIAYSIRGGEPQWRAFIDQAEGGLAEPQNRGAI